jgi:hypothetical protein
MTPLTPYEIEVALDQLQYLAFHQWDDRHSPQDCEECERLFGACEHLLKPFQERARPNLEAIISCAGFSESQLDSHLTDSGQQAES